MIRFAEYLLTAKLPYSSWIALGLWGALWLSISPGEFDQILNPSSLIGFLNGLRTILPFFALSVTLGWVFYNLKSRNPSVISIFNPLTMLILYGLIGTIAAYKSPDTGIALRWASLYLSVPIVLWAIIWNGDASLIWEGHKAGREIGYCHLEKLHNLESIPSKGFTISCFPVKIKGASAGWTRAVAIID